MGQADLDIYRILPSATADYMFFSATFGRLTKADYMLCHKAIVNNFRRVGITHGIFSDHRIKPEINIKSKHKNFQFLVQHVKSLEFITPNRIIKKAEQTENQQLFLNLSKN